MAQTAAEIESEDVKRVGARLACQCGSCQGTIACEMPGGCGYCKRMKTKIAQMQKVGADDKQIIAQIVKENGPKLYLAEPGAGGWAIPYAAAGLGALAIVFFVRRNLKSHPAAPQTAAAGGPPVDDTLLDRYNDRIEKDLQKLE